MIILINTTVVSQWNNDRVIGLIEYGVPANTATLESGNTAPNMNKIILHITYVVCDCESKVLGLNNKETFHLWSVYVREKY